MKYGNFYINRRVASIVFLLIVSITIIMSPLAVRADDIPTTTYTGTTMYSVGYVHGYEDEGLTSETLSTTINYTSASPVYSFIAEEPVIDGQGNILPKRFTLICGFCSASEIHAEELSDITPIIENGCYFYKDRLLPLDWSKEYSEYITKMINSSSDIFQLVKDVGFYQTISDFLKTGTKADGMIVGGSDTHPTDVTNESIGYLEDVKLNLSYVTPIMGDGIFTPINHQIYTDMLYNLKWKKDKTSTGYGLRDSYVQVYAKAEYRKSEFDEVTATDFIELGDFEKASKGKLQFSFNSLLHKSTNCSSAYLADFPISKPDYESGNLAACSVTPNIKYQFYIRVIKGVDRGPWLCVTEKRAHSTNEFVGSDRDVKSNVSSGGLDTDGNFNPDGNVDYNSTGKTGTGTDAEDATADTNSNDKARDKRDNSTTAQVFDELENFVQGMGQVPQIIADMFSFLPEWCLNVVGVSFALLMILLVVKFIRG